jgi:hypothetical protein
VLRKWYEKMTHRERPVYLYHAVLLVVRRKEIDWDAEPPEVDTPASEVEALYQAHLAGREVELDDFVFDVHAGGPAQGGLTRFAREGALVVNEAARFRNEDYRRVYNALKERLDVYNASGPGGGQ